MGATLKKSRENYNDYEAWEKVFANIGMFPEPDRPILESTKEQFDSFVNPDEIEELNIPALTSLGNEILDWYF